MICESIKSSFSCCCVYQHSDFSPMTVFAELRKKRTFKVLNLVSLFLNMVTFSKVKGVYLETGNIFHAVSSSFYLNLIWNKRAQDHIKCDYFFFKSDILESKRAMKWLLIKAWQAIITFIECIFLLNIIIQYAICSFSAWIKLYCTKINRSWIWKTSYFNSWQFLVEWF